jgi:thiol-disulfide isomerase/thioredoxin
MFQNIVRKESDMKRMGFVLPVMLAFLCVFMGGHVVSAQAKAKVEKMRVGETYPEILLGPLPGADAGQYLGMVDVEIVVLQQIPARLVIIDVLNVLCPDCHKNIPKLNRLYNIIQNDADLKSDIRVIAIAAGNDEKQIRMFADQYGIRFPVFADPEDAVYYRLGAVGPPGLIITESAGKVRYLHEGVIKDFDGLLETIRDIHRQP